MTRRPVQIDGSCYAGSGSIVRQAVAYSALTGRPVEVRNARARRPHPGLRHQHLRAVEAIRDLVGGTLDGAAVGSQSFAFQPGVLAPAGRYRWDIGTAGSATMLALAVLPIAGLRGRGVEIEIRGGLFQDFAPSPFHLQHVVLPLLGRMGLLADIELVRPGYLPAGEGILRMSVPPARSTLRPLVLRRAGTVCSVWGVALASHLQERRVPARMAAAARAVLAEAGMSVDIEERDDTTAAQPGAAFALFAELEGGARLGADRAGAPHRRAETIGARVARRLVDDLTAGATVDRFAADQLLPFVALAVGKSTYRPAAVTEHVETGAWLAGLFLGADVAIEATTVSVQGHGLLDIAASDRRLGRSDAVHPSPR